MASLVSQDFVSLTPDKLLSHVTHLGWLPLGTCQALGSLENRVYKIDCEQDVKLVVKCYRPNRWRLEQIVAEHHFLRHCAGQDIPVAAPLQWHDGQSIYQDQQGLMFAIFPWLPGRSPDELSLAEYEQLGRLLGRLHQIGQFTSPLDRPRFHAGMLGDQALSQILSFTHLSDTLQPKMHAIWQALRPMITGILDDLPQVLLHGDCHRGNVLRYQERLFLLDFDDAMYGPMEQDIWLLLPGRPKQCPEEFSALLRGYASYGAQWVEPSLMAKRIEALRTLRYLRYTAWVVERWQDPAFSALFSHYAHPATLEQLLLDLQEQYGQLEF